MGCLFRRRRSIRATGSLPQVLSAVGLVDHHAHGILREPPRTLNEFRGLFSESPDPRQWPHVATGVTYRRAMRELAELLGCDEGEQGVYDHRLAADPAEYASTLLHATGSDWLLVDDGFPPREEAVAWDELGELAGCRSAPVMRIERVAEEVEEPDHVREVVAAARANGFVALKTISAYRTGLELERIRDFVVAALDANERTGEPLPVQVHCGFGDWDLYLPRADPAHLKPLLERFRATTFVLLHCYPYIREAGWLAHVYGNVFFDVSLTIPHVARPGEALREALELAPVSKLLYASDASRTPELYYLAAKWWREGLAEVLPELLAEDEVEDAGRAILRENALRLYRL
ncbi:MAG TPA: amidohydrolase family protein [Gaiellaceae bacterium]